MIPHISFDLRVRALLLVLSFFSPKFFSQSIGITAPVSSSSYCAGSSVNISYTVSSPFTSPNTFSAQVSDNIGSFTGNPVTIGTVAATGSGVISCTIPSTLFTSSFYRFRVVASNPAVNGSDNGANLTIVSISLNSPMVTQTSFCQSETLTVNFSQSTCNFVNVPATNVYSVELSNASGSFANPTVIGTRTAVTAAAITCTIPPGTPAGSGYRIRISASTPATTGPDNLNNLSIMSAVGNPTVFGVNKWNVYCYNTRNDYSTNYQGNYSETALSFNTTGKWANNISPSSASGYAGCIFPPTSVSFSCKRTAIPCGYYQIDIPTHRSEVYLYINGVLVFSHTTGSGDAHPAVFRDMIEPSDEIEFRCSTISGTGNLQVTFTKLNQLTMSAPVTVCASSNATLSAFNTGTLAVNYAWTPTISVSPTTGTTTIANPSASQIYTVIATEPVTGCPTFSGTVLVTVAANPTTNYALSTVTTCAGFTSSTLTATGANTYSWSPSTGLNTTTGNIVVASPTVTTVYSVTGSNNCISTTIAKTVVVRTPPSTPSPTAFGNNLWNVFCYSGSTNFSNLYGVYTETMFPFTSTTRWAQNSNPSNANGSSGAAYSGCILANSGYAIIAKRQGFPCGYYSININHDDYVALFINGTSVFTHSVSGGDSHTGVWEGFLGSVSTAELRLVNYTGNTSSVQCTFSVAQIPDLSPPVTICAGTSATLTAVNVPGISYDWKPVANLSATSGTITISSTPVNTNYTCTVTDAATSCTSAATTSVTINPLPTTNVSPTTATINCTAQNYTLNAAGANTYSWYPSAGLSFTTGNSVVASPTVNTTYTVIGSNNCAATSVTTNIDIVPLVNPTVFPTGLWNAYCYNTTVISPANYYGYYTEFGTGTSGYDFNTALRWAVGTPPSGAGTSALGDAYKGCTMPATQWIMSFKRTGFECNTYTINPIGNDEVLAILINGVQVASRPASVVNAPLWVGTLSSLSTVEMRITQTTGPSSLNIVFTKSSATPTPAVWTGVTNNNWFVASNWCGSAIPTLADDVIINNSGTSTQPVITTTGAECANLTISGARAAVTNSTSAIAAAVLTMGANSSIDVAGNWFGYGTFTSGSSSTVSMVGSGAKSINCTSAQNFNRLVLNNTGNITFSPGTHRISGGINFLSGIAIQTGTLQFLTGSTATNASDISYVDGQVVKFGNQPFIFPVGGANLYRPIGISAPAVATDNFTAEYHDYDASPPFTCSLTDVSIHHISRCEHWILNRTGGSSIVNVTLSWNTNSCGVDNLTDLIVARWDAGQVKWKDHGNGGTTGDLTAGTLVSTSPVTVFSPFTLASRTPLNILPIELRDFKASCAHEGTILKWSTATEKNNNYFIVESSYDGASWMELMRLNSQGNSSSVKNYAFTDDRFGDGMNYYRLSQVDKDGTRKTFKIISSDCKPLFNEFKFYPNPAAKEINLVFKVSENHTDGVITVTDNLGRTCLTQEMDLKKGANKFNLPLKLNSGIYYISFTSDTFNSPVQKLIIE